MDKKTANNTTRKKLTSWRKNQSEAYKTYVKTSAVGLEFGLAIVIGALLGYFIDRYFSSSPWGVIVGMALGFVAGIKRLIIFMKNYLKNNDNHDQ